MGIISSLIKRYTTKQVSYDLWIDPAKKHHGHKDEYKRNMTDHISDSVDISCTCICRCRERDKQMYMCLAPKYKIRTIVKSPYMTMTVKISSCKHFASCNLGGTTCKPENTVVKYNVVSNVPIQTKWLPTYDPQHFLWN